MDFLTTSITNKRGSPPHQCQWVLLMSFMLKHSLLESTKHAHINFTIITCISELPPTSITHIARTILTARCESKGVFYVLVMIYLQMQACTPNTHINMTCINELHPTSTYMTNVIIEAWKENKGMFFVGMVKNLFW